MLGEPLDLPEQVPACLGAGFPQLGEKLLHPADNRPCNLPVDDLWNPPSAALRLRRHIELLFPLFEKFAAEIQQPVEQGLVKSVRRQHDDCPAEQRGEFDIRQMPTQRLTDKYAKISIIDGADHMRQHAYEAAS